MLGWICSGSMLAWLCSSPIAPAQAQVWVVGPGGQFADIQPAVDAAADGDVLLVEPGLYTSFFVDDKALSIVGDFGGPVRVQGQVRIENLAAKKLLVLARLQVEPPTTLTEALRTRHNAGSLRIQGCTFTGKHSTTAYEKGGGAAWIAFDADVIAIACDLTGGDGLSTLLTPGPMPGGTALFARSSDVELYGCVLRGGDGGSNGEEGYDGAKGGNGLEMPEGTTLATGCQLVGGDGGNGGEEDGFPPYLGNYAGDGGSGGHGVFLGTYSYPPASANPVLRWRGSTLQGGAGGVGGNGYWGPNGQPGAPGLPVYIANGTEIPLGGPARFLDGRSPEREGNSALLTFTGPAGDHVYLRVEYPLPPAGPGHQALTAVLRDALDLGVIPATGELSVHVPVPELGPGVETRTWILRPTFVDAQGAEWQANPLALTLLDQQF